MNPDYWPVTNAVDTFRDVANRPGVVYDPTKTTSVFAEDSNNHSEAIKNIEQEIGPNISQSWTTVDASLTWLSNKINALLLVRWYNNCPLYALVTGGTVSLGNTFTGQRQDVGQGSNIQLFRQITWTAGTPTNLQLYSNFRGVAPSGLTISKVEVGYRPNTTNALTKWAWFDVAYDTVNLRWYVDVAWTFLTGNGYTINTGANIYVRGIITRPTGF